MKFRHWCKQYKSDKQEKDFLPVSLTAQKVTGSSNTSLLNVGMKLPNDFQLQFSMPVSELLSLIRGLCDAP